MASTATERFRRNIHLRDSSVPISHMISSSREIGEKLKENQSDFVPVPEFENSWRYFKFTNIFFF